MTSIRKILPAIYLPLFLTSLPAAAAPAKGSIKVFILAGQSNMEGKGVVSMDDPKNYNGGKGNLVWAMEHSQSAAKMKRLKNEKGDWDIRDDLEISNKVDGKVRKGGLTVGYTNFGGSSHIGPELGFNPHFPARWSDPMALSGASRIKQTPSS
jgi:hypothetical protein